MQFIWAYLKIGDEQEVGSGRNDGWDNVRSWGGQAGDVRQYQAGVDTVWSDAKQHHHSHEKFTRTPTQYYQVY